MLPPSCETRVFTWKTSILSPSWKRLNSPKLLESFATKVKTLAGVFDKSAWQAIIILQVWMHTVHLSRKFVCALTVKCRTFKDKSSNWCQQDLYMVHLLYILDQHPNNFITPFSIKIICPSSLQGSQNGLVFVRVCEKQFFLLCFLHLSSYHFHFVSNSIVYNF